MGPSLSLISAKTWPLPTACRRRCRDTSGQSTQWVGSERAASGLPEPTAVWRRRYTQPWPPAGQDPALSTSGRTPALLSGKPTRASRPVLTAREPDTRCKETAILQPTAGQTLPWDRLGPGPFHQQANAGFRTSRTPYPAVSGEAPLPPSPVI